MTPDFTASAPELAKKLVGWRLCYDDGEGERGGIVAETEAYTIDDPASHSFRGKTNRNAAMFNKPGTVYIYQIYGLHYCLNIVCGNHDGQAVLIRSLLPSIGIGILKINRGGVKAEQLCNGPAKLFQALDVSPKLNGLHITKTGLRLLPPTSVYSVSSGVRIGVSKGIDTAWRFYLSPTK